MRDYHFIPRIDQSSVLLPPLCAGRRQFPIRSPQLDELMSLSAHRMTPSCRLKILLVGEALVGKSCLLARIANEPFAEASVRSYGVDSRVHTIQVDQEVVELLVWASPSIFDYLAWKYGRHSHGIIVVYDVTNQGSLDKVPS